MRAEGWEGMPIGSSTTSVAALAGVIPEPWRDAVVVGAIAACGLCVAAFLAVSRRRLREKDSQLRSLIDHSTASIYVKDLQGRYLLVNRRHAEIWPTMRHFRPGTTPYDWFPADVARNFVETDGQVWKSGRELTFEEVIPHPDGPHDYVSVKFPIFNSKGHVIAVGGISADVTELKQARESLERKERVLRRLIEVQESEKQILCHEFHDGLIQYAVGSKMMLESLPLDRLEPEVAATVDAVVEFLSKGLEDGRRVIRGIRPAALDDLGLKAALEELVGQFTEMAVGVEADLDEGIDGIPRSLQTTVYRIVQESLSNARKHAAAGSIRVRARRAGDRVDVEVEDSGCGFDVRAAGQRGFGLVGMSERVLLAGGTCRVESEPGAGTRITVRLPLQEEPLADQAAVPNRLPTEG
jgi:PAS domain S-box-containing protein